MEELILGPPYNTVLYLQGSGRRGTLESRKALVVNPWRAFVRVNNRNKLDQWHWKVRIQPFVVLIMTMHLFVLQKFFSMHKCNHHEVIPCIFSA